MSTPNAAALEARIRTIRADAASAAQLLKDKSFDLALSPSNAELREQVEKLEAEIAGHDREIGRMEAAIHELSRRSSVAERRKHLAQLSEHHRDVMSAGKRQAKIAAELLDKIEALGPLLSEYATLSDTRRELARGILRGNMNLNRRGVYEDAAAWRNGPVSPIIAAALWRAGLGRLGMDLEPWLSLTPPRAKDDRYLRGDLAAVLAEDIAKADALLSRGLGDVIQSQADELNAAA